MTRLPPGASLPGYIVKPSGSLLLMVLATRSEALAVPQNVIGTCRWRLARAAVVADTLLSFPALDSRSTR